MGKIFLKGACIMRIRSRQEIKYNAKQAVAAQRGTAITANVIIFGLGLVVSFATSILGRIFFPLSWFISMGGTLFTSVLTINAIAVYIKIYKGETANAGDILNDLPMNFWRKFGGAA